MATLSNLNVKVLAPAVARTTTVTGAPVDLQTYLQPGGRLMKCFLDVGAITTAGTLTVTVQESATTTAADFAAVGGATTAFTAVTDATGTQEIHVKVTKRYVRCVGTFAAATNGYTFGVYAVAELREV